MPISAIGYKYHHFWPAIIRYAVWLYHRFTQGLRDVEDLLAERGVGVSYGTIRRRVITSGPAPGRDGPVWSVPGQRGAFVLYRESL